jgi:hypothetical protein
MQVSQVAYDRFVLELPAADATWRPLADPEVVAETAAWLWDFGPKPLIAVVGFDRDTPKWLSAWKSRGVRWTPPGVSAAAAVALASRADLERFLTDGAPHEHTILFWARGSEQKTLAALNAGPTAWQATVDAEAIIERGGELFEVSQIQA